MTNTIDHGERGLIFVPHRAPELLAELQHEAEARADKTRGMVGPSVTLMPQTSRSNLISEKPTAKCTCSDLHLRSKSTCSPDWYRWAPEMELDEASRHGPTWLFYDTKAEFFAAGADERPWAWLGGGTR